MLASSSTTSTAGLVMSLLGGRCRQRISDRCSSYTVSGVTTQRGMARAGRMCGTRGQGLVAPTSMRLPAVRILLIEEAMVHGEESQLETVGSPDLVEDVGQVVLDRVFAEDEL